MLYKLVSIFLCLQFVYADIINYASYQNLTRIKRADECGFQCKSDGKCINSVDECNGIEECADGSDETDNCANQWCPNYLFRCNYGACISKVGVCDGNKDCRDNSDETQPGCKTPEAQATCKNDQFQCKSGECISSTFECNGKADCRDKSDETDECKKAFCFKYLFRCDYGACVDGDAKCNGVIDCLDGSDENPALCGGTTVTPKPTPKPTKPTKKPTKKPTPTPTPPTVTPSTNGGCVLPEYPENGQWKLVIAGQNRYPGSVVDSYTIIQAKCEANYLLVGKNISICLEGRWTENFKCEQSCPSWESSATTNITCTYGGLPRDCKYPIHDTEAEFYCAPFHEDTTTSNKRYCINSSWNNAKPRCDPICGQKRVKNSPLSVGGTPANEGDYPWQVALFKKVNNEFKAICGGSVLTAKVVITAAHCMITDTEINENKSPVTADFQLAAGKYYRTYHHPNDKHTQYRLIKEILPHPDYRGVWGNYNGDLALLVVTQEFVFGPYVQPVCRDNGNILHLQSGQEGVVTGWGYTKVEGAPAEILTELKVPFEEDSVCKSKLPEEYVRRFYANDKLCAGFYNQICGQKRVKNSPLSVGGTPANEGHYPWQVALFKKVNNEFKAICGGSVLTAKVVITAAHCMITDTEINENKSPATADFQLAAGKYYRTYHHPNDKHTQYRLVKEILPHPDYRGVWGNYNGDLALLVVTQEFVFGPYVQPVCRDNGNILHLQSGQEGVVTGWGYTKVEGAPAEILTELKVPFEEDSVCKSKLPEEYVRRFYANDKLCAGFYNQSKAICSGDSGGGLVFPHNGRYYIRGLVSISPRVNNSCDIQQYTLFTKVNWYSTFIDKTILKYDRLI